MTWTGITTYPLKRGERATRWLTHAMHWVKTELHAAQRQSQDEQFLATGKGAHYRGM